MDNILGAVIALILWAASIYGGWRIMRWKNRWAALVACVFLGPLGFLLALFMDARCPSCYGLMSMAADVCPHCGRNKSDGKVTIRR